MHKARLSPQFNQCVCVWLSTKGLYEARSFSSSRSCRHTSQPDRKHSDFTAHKRAGKARWFNDRKLRAPLHDSSYFSRCFSAREPSPAAHHAGQRPDTNHHSQPTSNSGDNRQARPVGEHQETVSQCRPAQHALVSAHRSHN